MELHRLRLPETSPDSVAVMGVSQDAILFCCRDAFPRRPMITQWPVTVPSIPGPRAARGLGARISPESSRALSQKGEKGHSDSCARWTSVMSLTLDVVRRG
eukprot:8554747-Pyramimonas_sp.AAC.1